MAANLYNSDVTAINVNLGGAAGPDGMTLSQPPSAVTAAGTTQATAAVLGGVVNNVTVAANTGVILPPAVPTQTVVIYPASATNALLIYPQVGGTINGGTVNASFSATAKTPYICICLDTLNWIIK